MSVCIWCFFFRQKTAYEMRISDWSSDVCSSDLGERAGGTQAFGDRGEEGGARGGVEQELRHQEAGGAVERRGLRQRVDQPGMELAAVGEPVALGACAACVEHCRRGVEREEAPAREALRQVRELGRASGRDRVCKYVSVSVLAASLKKKKKRTTKYKP